MDTVGPVGCGSGTAFPHLHDWFRVSAFFPRPDPSVGRGNGRSQGEWTPHRGRRRLDCRNSVALRRCLDHTQSERLPGRAQSTCSLVLLRSGVSAPAALPAATSRPAAGLLSQCPSGISRATSSIPSLLPRLREYFFSAALFQCSWTPRLESRVPSPSGS